MSTKITYSSELMSNYIQGETVAPDAKFEALQSNDGHSLLFSIGTDKKFYLTEEVISQVTGWQKNDLSSSLAADFSAGSAMTVKTFAVGQSNTDSSFSVALVVSVSGADYLYIAQSYNRNADGYITLNWVAIPFDAENKNYNPLIISDVYVLQAASGPLIVVNVVPPGSNTLERYYINTFKGEDDPYWNMYTLPFNMEAESSSICGGRKSGEIVDGIYSLGLEAGTPSVYYQQLYNPFQSSLSGATSQLRVGSDTPSAMASTVSADGKSTDEITYTDLYVVTTEGDLYFFAAAKQTNGVQGEKIMTSDLFKEVTALYAYTQHNKVVVWGINRSQQIFYTSCATGSVTTVAAWSYPLPIATGVEQISPYINRVNGGNTFFAHMGANSFKKVTQDPVSTSWQTQDILLPVDASTPAQKVDCYMTRITVTDENNAALAGASVKVAAAYRVPVYINNHYYVLDTAPITLLTDAQGALKIVQVAVDMQGACLSVQSAGGGPVLNINPMDNSAAKIATLNTPEALSAAEVTDDNSNPVKPLVPTDTSDDDLSAAAGSIQSLSDAYNAYTPTAASPSAKMATGATSFSYSPQTKVYRLSVGHSTMQLNVIDDVSDTLSSIGDAIVCAAGDITSWLKGLTEYVIQIIEDTAQKVWNFVVTVAGQVYTFVIDTIEKVMEAVMAIFNALKTIVKDLIQFLKFLFSWGDISRTKDVMVSMTQLYLRDGVKMLSQVKGLVGAEIQELKSMIDEWAGLSPATDTSEYGSEPLNYQQSQTDYSNVYTSPNTYLQDNFTDNVANATDLGDSGNTSPVTTTLESLINTLKDALESEVTVMTDAVKQFQTELFDNDKYKSMSLMDIIKVCIGIVSDTVLDTINVVVDAFIDIVVAVLDGIIDLMVQPIWIPVVSEILEEIFGASIKFSMLDILCLVGAIPATLVYKLTFGTAPFFEDDGFSNQIINAGNQAMGRVSVMQLNAKAEASTSSVDLSTELDSKFDLSNDAKDTIFFVTHLFSGCMAIVNGVLIFVEDSLQKGYIRGVTPARAISNLLQQTSFGASTVFAQPYPIQNKGVALLSDVLTLGCVASQLIFGLAPKVMSEGTKATMTYVGAAVDIGLNLTSFAPIACHFLELANTESNTNRSLAIVNDTAKICNYLAVIGTSIAKYDKEAVSSMVIAGVASACALCNGGLQISESFVLELAD